jgi:hypothetical protein
VLVIRNCLPHLLMPPLLLFKFRLDLLDFILCIGQLRPLRLRGPLHELHGHINGPVDDRFRRVADQSLPW